MRIKDWTFLESFESIWTCFNIEKFVKITNDFCENSEWIGKIPNSNIWENSKIFGKIPKYLENFRNNWKNSKIFGKIPKYLENS